MAVGPPGSLPAPQDKERVCVHVGGWVGTRCCVPAPVLWDE